MAISQPTTPPPTTSSRPGTSLALVASRGVQGSIVAQPVDRRHGCGRARCTPPRRAARSAGSRCRRPPSRRRCARRRAGRCRGAGRCRRPSTHLTCRTSSQLRGEGVASGEGRGDVLLAGHRLLGAVDGAGRGERLGAAQQRLARHAGPVGALTADEFGLDEDGGQPALDDDVGDVLPRRPRPEDDDVVGVLARVRAPLDFSRSLPRGPPLLARSSLRCSRPCPLTGPILSVWSTHCHARRRRSVRHRLPAVRRRRVPADRPGRHRRRRRHRQLGHERVGGAAAGRRRSHRRSLPGRGARRGRPVRADRPGRRARDRGQPVRLGAGGRAPGTCWSRCRGHGRAAARSCWTRGRPPSTAGCSGCCPVGDHVLALLEVEDVPVLNPTARPLIRLRGRYVDEDGHPAGRP